MSCYLLTHALIAPLPFEDEGSEPVPGDDESTDTESDDGNIHPEPHTMEVPEELLPDQLVSVPTGPPAVE